MAPERIEEFFTFMDCSHDCILEKDEVAFVKQAIKRQIPRRTLPADLMDAEKYAECPNGDTYLPAKCAYAYRFCPKCGQALDWEKEEK